MGWIKQDMTSRINFGCTLEKLMDIKSGNFEIPDYNGIEIKTKKIFSKSYLKLFNSSPDGRGLFEIKRLKEKYGYPDSILKNMKVLNISVCANNYLKIGMNYLFKLMVDRENKKLYLNIFDKNGKLIDNETFWSFELLEEKLIRKLQLLAVIDVLTQKNNNIEYYKYIEINFYKLKDFESFIYLIEKGYIRITFKVSVFRTGKRLGQTHDHGTGFEIKEEDLQKLYYLIKV